MVTNYPRWSPASSTTPHVAEFISTTGQWRCATVGVMGDGKEYWGVVFSNSPAVIEALALTRNGAPYNLMLTYGDADEGAVMTFAKKK